MALYDTNSAIKNDLISACLSGGGWEYTPPEISPRYSGASAAPAPPVAFPHPSQLNSLPRASLAVAGWDQQQQQQQQQQHWL